MSTESFAGEVRHKIDVSSLTSYLNSVNAQLFAAPLKLKQFGYGQSNPSYLVEDSKGHKYVLRKQPPGKLMSKSAHRVDREYAMIKALEGLVPVPKVFVLCEDTNVIGTQFYLMEFLQGRIFHSPDLEGASSEAERTQLWDAVIKALTQLHAVDPRKIGLDGSLFNLTNIGSHFPRQMKTLTAVANAQAQTGIGSIPHMAETVSYLETHLPANRAGIVHGDFKIDNIVFHPTKPEVIGFLDWELCTIGHPLADIGNLLHAFSFDENMRNNINQGMLFVHAGKAGVPTLDQILALYAKYSGVYDPRPDWKFAVAFTHLRLSVILHGIAARVTKGQASSAQADKYAKMFPFVGELAYKATLQGSSSKL